MTAAWRTRHTELHNLIPDARNALLREVSEKDRQSGRVIECLNSDHPGELLDLLEYHVNQQQHEAQRSHRLFQQAAELQLKYKRDLTVVHTLAEEPSLGSSVTVVTASNLGTSSKVHAVKTISKSSALKLEGQTSIQHERDILVASRNSNMKHAPLLIGALQDATHLHLVLEYLPAGDIGLLLTERKVLPLRWVRLWIAQTFQAIAWLHDLGYAHRDIKPANILLELSGHAKLADYGSAGPLHKRSPGLFVLQRYCLTPVGTVDYIAPDILLAHEKAVMDSDDEDDDEEDLNSPGLYDASVDLWSLGVSMYEMLTGTLPFYAETIPETYERILKHETCLDFQNLRMDTSAKDLLRHLITDPSNRINSEALKSHSFFADLAWDKIRETPAPFRPPIRSLKTQAGQTSREEFSRGFDFSALFSSPGLSILRNTEPDETELRWLGFTFLPEKNEFEKQIGEISQNQLLPDLQPVKALVTAYPTTPARSSAPMNNVNTGIRPRENARALQEIVTYTILRTTRKASAQPARKPAPPVAEPVSPVRSRLPELAKRHEDLLARISNIETKYKTLLDSSQRF